MKNTIYILTILILLISCSKTDNFPGNDPWWGDDFPNNPDNGFKVEMQVKLKGNFGGAVALNTRTDALSGVYNGEYVDTTLSFKRTIKNGNYMSITYAFTTYGPFDPATIEYKAFVNDSLYNYDFKTIHYEQAWGHLTYDDTIHNPLR